MIEGQEQEHGQFERNGLNQSQKQSQERGCLMIEGANRGIGLWLGWMRGLGKDRVSGMIEGQDQDQQESQAQSQREGLHSGRRERTGGNASASQRQG